MKTTKNRFGADVFVGYQYSRVVSVAGQIHVGYSGQDIKLSKVWDSIHTYMKGSYTESYHSDLVVKNLVNFGAETFIGADFGTTTGIFVYGIFGAQVESFRLSGSGHVTVSTDETVDKYYVLRTTDPRVNAANLGKEAVTFDKLEVAGVQQTTKFVPTAMFGLGTRICFRNRFFVGLEGRYHLKRSPEIEAKVACNSIDFEGVSTSSQTSEKVPLRSNHFSVGATVGVFF
jgi:hypothetical protein